MGDLTLVPIYQEKCPIMFVNEAHAFLLPLVRFLTIPHWDTVRNVPWERLESQIIPRILGTSLGRCERLLCFDTRKTDGVC